MRSASKLRPRVAGAATIAMLLVAGGGCAEPRSEERVSFRIAPRLSSLVAYLAADGGYFAAEGVEVDLIDWDNSSAVIPSLAQGDLDASTVHRLDPAYFNLIARGGRIRFVAAGMVYAAGECGYSAFVARPGLLESGALAELSGLRGLRIASERTSSNYYIWARLLEQAGLTSADVGFVDTPGTVIGEALAGGLIDLSIANEPRRSQLLRRGQARLWRPVADVLPDVQNSFVLFGRRLLEERRDLGVRFLRAYQRAASDYVEQGVTPRLLDIVAARTHLRPEELREMCWPTYSKDGFIDRRSFDEYQRWAAGEGLIDEVLPLESVFDSGYLRAAGAPPAD